MMDHEQYRSAIMADPRDPDPDVREHRESCPECSAFGESLQRFESRLERALKVEIPTRAAILAYERTASTRPHRPWRRFAIAASLVLGVGLAGVLWLALPQSSLAADVVAHVQAEPESWQHPDAAITGPALNAVLKRFEAASEIRCRYRQLCQQLLLPKSLCAASGGANRVGARDRDGAGT